MCTGFEIAALALGSLGAATSVAGALSKPQQPKIDTSAPDITPSASALQSMTSVGTGAKVALGKNDKDKQLTTSGAGSITGGAKNSLGGVSGGAGLKL